MAATLDDVYCFWTNKGGVGKTTLCYHAILTYAALHREDTVIAVDCDPQVNLSHALLTKLSTKKEEKEWQTEFTPGQEHVDVLKRASVNHNSMLAPTIAGYLGMRLAGEAERENLFLTRVHDYNENAPDNIYLLCGDDRLPLLEEEMRQKCGGAVGIGNPWRKGHEYLKVFIRRAADQLGGNCVGFFDTNPADIMPTRMALLASSKLVVPVNADDFSKSALKNMFNFMYGLFLDPEDPLVASYADNHFSRKVKLYGMQMPKVHMVVHNRNPVISNARKVAAFEALQADQAALLFQAYERARRVGLDIFSLRGTTPNNPTEFANMITGTVRDMMSCGIVSIHYGVPLWRLKRHSVVIKSRLDNANISTSRISSIGDFVGCREARSANASRCFMQLLLDDGDEETRPLPLTWSNYIREEAEVTANRVHFSPSASRHVIERPSGPPPKRIRFR